MNRTRFADAAAVIVLVSSAAWLTTQVVSVAEVAHQRSSAAQNAYASEWAGLLGITGSEPPACPPIGGSRTTVRNQKGTP